MQVSLERRAVEQRMGMSAPFPDGTKLAFDGLAVLESIDDGFVSLDTHWCFTYVNRAAERIFHRKREDLLRKNIWEVFPHVVGTVFWKKCHEAANSHTIIDVEDMYPSTGRWFSTRISPSEVGVIVSFHETTQRHQGAEDGRHREQRAQIQASLIELAYDAIKIGRASCRERV